jgi:hypothetical protein
MARRGAKLSGAQFVGAVQTAGIVVIAAMLILTGRRVTRAIDIGVAKLTETLGSVAKTQSQLEQNVRRIWERIDTVEGRMTRLEKRVNGSPSGNMS